MTPDVRRSASHFRRRLLAALVAGVALGALAHNPPVGLPRPLPVAGGTGFQLVQRVDDVLFGVDSISLAVFDRRYVAGTFVRLNVHVPSPVIGYTSFVADCEDPMRMAISESATAFEDRNAVGFLSQKRTQNQKLDPSSLAFADSKMLDGTRLVAEFACGSTRQPGRATQLARALYERGGPHDLQSVFCDMQVDGGKAIRSGVEVRYSETEDVVAVQQQWLSSGFVTAVEVVFGSGGVQWIMDRQTLATRLITKAGKTLFAGRCERQAAR